MSSKAVILQIVFFYYWMHIVTDTGVNCSCPHLMDVEQILVHKNKRFY